MNTRQTILDAIQEGKYEIDDKLTIKEDEKNIKSSYSWKDVTIWIGEVSILFDLDVDYMVESDEGDYETPYSSYSEITNPKVTIKEIQIDDLSVKLKNNEWFFLELEGLLEEKLEPKFYWES